MWFCIIVNRWGCIFMSHLSRAALAGFLAASLTFPILAQNITGTILGSVKDASGAVVSGAEVAVTNLDTNQAAKTMTNQLGNYEVPYLRPGRYQVKVTGSGFKNVVRE